MISSNIFEKIDRGDSYERYPYEYSNIKTRIDNSELTKTAMIIIGI